MRVKVERRADLRETIRCSRPQFYEREGGNMRRRSDSNRVYKAKGPHFTLRAQSRDAVVKPEKEGS
jgi:hypothetical protein